MKSGKEELSDIDHQGDYAWYYVESMLQFWTYSTSWQQVESRKDGCNTSILYDLWQYVQEYSEYSAACADWNMTNL